MKNLKFILLLFLGSSLFIKCNCSKDDDLEEGTDMSSPVITVVSPNQNAIFYTENGVDSPDYVVINATATDEYKIIAGRVRVLNSLNQEVHYYQELSSQQNGISIEEVYTSFTTIQEGNYTIIFEFEDSSGNIATKTRNITCQYSATDGNTDTRMMINN